MNAPDKQDRELVDHATLVDLADWRVLAGSLQACFETGDFATALALANEIGEAAEAANHHPDLDLRYGALWVSLRSHDVQGLTRRDRSLAERISALVAASDATAAPHRLTVVEMALDSHDLTEVLPFWSAVLDQEVRQADEVVDSQGRRPVLWFQEADATSEEPQQRFHYDVWVPHDQAQPRIDAALAAGGTLVYDGDAPSFWVLADSQGNKACICTWQNRK